MHDSQAKTEARVRTALEMRLRPRVWASREPCEVSVFASGSQVTVQDGLAGAYVPIDPGAPWGAPWSTTWFRISGKVPAEWAGSRVEALIDLGFDGRGPGFQAEGMAFDAEGVPIKGIAPLNNWLPVGSEARSGGSLDMFCRGRVDAWDHGRDR